MQTQTEFNAKNANRTLVGATIVKVEARDDQLIMVVTFDHGDSEYEVGVSRDPEGNGPGWIDLSALV